MYSEYVTKNTNLSYLYNINTNSHDNSNSIHSNYINEYPFGFNLKKILSKKHSLFDYCYDIPSEHWIRWRVMNLEEHSGLVTGDFIKDNLDLREIVRLNCDSIEYIGGKLHQEKFKQGHQEKGTLFVPDSSIFVETVATKQLKYLSTFAVSYSKPTLVLSKSQNGVTSCIRNKLKELVEQHSYSVSYIQLDETTSIKKVIFLKKIE